MKASNFKLIILGLFIIFAVLAVLTFAGVINIGRNSSGPVATGTVTMWGTVDRAVMASLLDDFNRGNKNYEVRYVEKQPEDFNQELLEALAEGSGPDLFLLPDDLVLSYTNRIYVTPYTSYPVASFNSSFASASDIFLSSQGVTAFPLTIDPMVMYYNRSILNSNNIVFPPAYWQEFQTITPLLTKKNENNQIIQSTVGLGQFANIVHAKDILATLFMQAGSDIVVEKDGFYAADLSNFDRDTNTRVLAPMLAFYTSFADPLGELYSWNRSLPDSRDYFTAENSAFYFGYASELQNLVDRNPNQDLQITSVPQIKNSTFKSTKARVTGIAISKFSQNLNTAFVAASALSTGDFARGYAAATGVAPARRDLLATQLTGAYLPSVYSSALFAKSWLDPSPEDTDNIFRIMVDNLLSNTVSANDAVVNASGRLQLLLVQ